MKGIMDKSSIIIASSKKAMSAVAPFSRAHSAAGKFIKKRKDFK